MCQSPIKSHLFTDRYWGVFEFDETPQATCHREIQEHKGGRAVVLACPNTTSVMDEVGGRMHVTACLFRREKASPFLHTVRASSMNVGYVCGIWDTSWRLFNAVGAQFNVGGGGQLNETICLLVFDLCLSVIDVHFLNLDVFL